MMRRGFLVSVRLVPIAICFLRNLSLADHISDRSLVQQTPRRVPHDLNLIPSPVVSQTDPLLVPRRTSTSLFGPSPTGVTSPPSAADAALYLSLLNHTSGVPLNPNAYNTNAFPETLPGLYAIGAALDFHARWLATRNAEVVEYLFSSVYRFCTENARAFDSYRTSYCPGKNRVYDCSSQSAGTKTPCCRGLDFQLLDEPRELDRDSTYCKEWAGSAPGRGSFCCRECLLDEQGGSSSVQNPAYPWKCSRPTYALSAFCGTPSSSGVSSSAAPFPGVSGRYSGFRCKNAELISDGQQAGLVPQPSSCDFVDELVGVNAGGEAWMSELMRTNGNLRAMFYENFFDIRSVVARQSERVFRNAFCSIHVEPKIWGNLQLDSVQDVRMIKPEVFANVTLRPSGSAKAAAKLSVLGGRIGSYSSMVLDTAGQVRVSDITIDRGGKLRVEASTNSVVRNVILKAGARLEFGRGTSVAAMHVENAGTISSRIEGGLFANSGARILLEGVRNVANAGSIELEAVSRMSPSFSEAWIFVFNFRNELGALLRVDTGASAVSSSSQTSDGDPSEQMQLQNCENFGRIDIRDWSLKVSEFVQSSPSASFRVSGVGKRSFDKLENRAGNVTIISSSATVRLARVWNRRGANLQVASPVAVDGSDLHNEGTMSLGAVGVLSSGGGTNKVVDGGPLATLTNLQNSGVLTLVGSRNTTVTTMTNRGNFSQLVGTLVLQGQIWNYGRVEMGGPAPSTKEWPGGNANATAAATTTRSLASSQEDPSSTTNVIRNFPSDIMNVFDNYGELVVRGPRISSVEVRLLVTRNSGTVRIEKGVSGQLIIQRNEPSGKLFCNDVEITTSSRIFPLEDDSPPAGGAKKNLVCSVVLGVAATPQPARPNTKAPALRPATILTISLDTVVAARCRSCDEIRGVQDLLAKLNAPVTNAFAMDYKKAFTESLAYVYNRLDGVSGAVNYGADNVQVLNMPGTHQLQGEEISVAAREFVREKMWRRRLQRGRRGRKRRRAGEQGTPGALRRQLTVLPSDDPNLFLLRVDFSIQRFVVGDAKYVEVQKSHTMDNLRKAFLDDVATGPTVAARRLVDHLNMWLERSWTRRKPDFMVEKMSIPEGPVAVSREATMTVYAARGEGGGNIGWSIFIVSFGCVFLTSGSSFSSW